MTITATFNSLEELVSFARSLTKGTAGKAMPEAEEKTGRSQKSETGKKEQKQGEAKAAAVKQEPEEEKQAGLVEELPFTYSLEDVRAKLASLPKAAARDLINSYGCSRLTEIPAEHYPELMQKAGAAHA